MNVKSLSLEEKFRLLTGKDCWYIDDLDGKVPSCNVSDGPNGLRHVTPDGKKVESVAYPNLSLLACSWNRETAKLMGDGIADDCIENGVDVLLAPGVNIKRYPLCGRNFEYFSEDPVLAGELGGAYIDGLQERGIGTSLKHFAANGNEIYRLYQTSEIDTRCLHELYLEAFRRAVKHAPWTVMCSYNRINGAYASENKWLLRDTLRGKFGFDGVIVSDWGAVQHRPKSLKAGVDLEMPCSRISLDELKKAYADGFITDEEVDFSAQKVIELSEKAEKSRKTRKVARTVEERLEVASQIAEESVVLLKNNGVLPLKKGGSATVYNNAFSQALGGSGSALVVPVGEKRKNGKISLFHELQALGYDVKDGLNRGLLNENVRSDYYIACVGSCDGYSSTEGEDFDRTSMTLPAKQLETVRNLCDNYDNVIVVIYTGSVVDVSEFKDRAAAIIYAGYVGENGNPAVAKIITGAVCPSGKLAETFPVSPEVTPVGSIKNHYYEFYGERYNVGYRYYDRHPEYIAYPFGFGLSYAKFEYSDLEIKKTGDVDFEISYNITNTSEVDGKEVSQIYVADEVCSCERPIKELKEFTKDLIKAGETKRITVKLDRHAFEFFNPASNDYYVENGYFRISVCSSSREEKLCGEVEIKLPDYTQFSVNFISDGRKLVW